MSETKAPSPFLPGTNIQFAFDSTSIGYLKTCPRLYQYIMIEGWSHKGENVHLRFGSEYHRALQEYDLSRAAGIPHDDALHDTIQELMLRIGDWWSDDQLLEMKGSATEKTKEALLRTVIWYLDKFKDDPAKTFILTDGKPAVEQSFRIELDLMADDSQPFLLCGHLDRVVEFNEELFVMDRKTTFMAPTSFFFDKFEPDNQMTLYSYAGQIVLHSPVRGVIIDAAQVKRDATEYGRGFTFRTPDQLKEWLEELRYWFALAEQFAISDRWPMNDTACDKFGGCRFREICSKSPSVREKFLKANFVQLPEEDRWNPLKPR